MKNLLFLIMFLLSFNIVCGQSEKLIYHDIRTDNQGKIIPWYSDKPGKAYSHVVQLVWRFWDTMHTDMNGLPYYMNHQVWQLNRNEPAELAVARSRWLFHPGLCCISLPEIKGLKRI